MNKYKDLDKIINENSQITSILASGYRRHSVVANILGQFGSRVMLWQTNSAYFPCNRMQLYYGVRLRFLCDTYKDDFDVLVVDSFRDCFNTKETIEFIEYVKSKNEFTNKKFIFIFTAVEMGKKFDIDSFTNFKETIEKLSDDIFLLRRTENYDILSLENCKTKEVEKYSYVMDATYNDMLVKVKDE
ncbi:MAG: hypothetical protein J6Q13_03050 [Clostridia bacterium]|nr:hypothetical protein [Clostridia bacterium]